MEFDFTIKYKKGAKNTITDAISRLPTFGETLVAPDVDIPCYFINEVEEKDDIPSWVFDPIGVIDYEPPGSGKEVEQVESDEISVCMSVHDFGDAEEDFNCWFDTIDNEDLLDSDKAVLATKVAGHLQPLTREEIWFAQQDDDDVKKLKTKWSLDPKQPYLENENGLFCRRAPNDGAIQIVLPASLRERVLLLAHYPRVAGHPGGSGMYQTLRQTFYWPSMSMDVYNTVRQCTSCAKERIAKRKHASYLSLFPAKAPLEYVAIDILGPLPYTTGKRNRYLLVIADRYSKLTKTVTLKNITAATVARAFVEHWVFQFGPPAELLSDNGGQFTSKFFQQVCLILCIKKLFTSAYHPQTNHSSREV